ncbi:unnamed protein product [Bursaphelenchus xylophilus]|uniref:(pine wood nematode) hypothetical protein n=1 Tax=Bursaphelenchus xylophilus TaxID=6326 RepID=A0A1I7RTX3_BURXY|nr:unnamed protein product [Bursaphelenchus xylophilus]CAG9132123.1 unnamed protein product [Bursaphelenchus xylophilus]
MSKFRSSHLPARKTAVAEPSEPKKHPVDVVKAKSYKPPATIKTVTFKDVITYALAVGATPENGLQYIFEKDPNFQVLPTYIARHAAVFSLDKTPGVEWDLFKILHAEQYIEVFKPIPAECRIRTEWKVSEVIDKVKAAIVVREVTMYDADTNEKLSHGIYNIIHLGAGGFNGQKISVVDVPCIAVPKEQPDLVFEEKTTNTTAALYRIASDDLNYVHIEPGFGKPMGLDRPILHGLCVLGMVSRLVIDNFGKKDVRSFKAIKARFTATAYVGETLVIEFWKRKDRVHFQVRVKETGKLNISNAFVDLHPAPTQSKL